MTWWQLQTKHSPVGKILETNLGGGLFRAHILNFEIAKQGISVVARFWTDEPEERNREGEWRPMTTNWPAQLPSTELDARVYQPELDRDSGVVRICPRRQRRGVGRHYFQIIPTH